MWSWNRDRQLTADCGGMVNPSPKFGSPSRNQRRNQPPLASQNVLLTPPSPATTNRSMWSRYRLRSVTTDGDGTASKVVYHRSTSPPGEASLTTTQCWPQSVTAFTALKLGVMAPAEDAMLIDRIAVNQVCG